MTIRERATRPERAPRVRVGGTSATMFNLRGLYILVVDDNDDSRVILKSTLDYYGAFVIAVASADLALHLMKQAAPDLIVSDLSMPDTDGITFVEAVRRLPVQDGGWIPAVALTGYDGLCSEREALQAGFQAYLVKPFDITVFCRTLQRLGFDVMGPPAGSAPQASA